MKLEATDASRVKALFGLVDKKPTSFPKVSALSKKLTTLAPVSAGSVNVDASTAKLFCTAAVDAWQRAVHSYLISISLTESSPIWSSVAGYYSSHYSIRAFAHLLGYFCLYGKKYVVRIQIGPNGYFCTFDKKGASDREHRTYWRKLRETLPFSTDSLYPDNLPDVVPSDVGHRDRANYHDHLVDQYVKFQIIDDTRTRLRLEKISKISITAAPIPNKEAFPDLDSVHIVAYHRLVAFRSLLDETISAKNTFWSACRNPGFAQGYLNYQLVEAPTYDN